MKIIAWLFTPFRWILARHRKHTLIRRLNRRIAQQWQIIDAHVRDAARDDMPTHYHSRIDGALMPWMR